MTLAVSLLFEVILRSHGNHLKYITEIQDLLWITVTKTYFIFEFRSIDLSQ